MALKPGFKLSEMGVLPEEWRIQPLGSICDVRDGTHESPRFFKDGVPLVTSKNIVDGRLDLENVSFISKTDAAEFDKRSKVDRDDILLSMIGTIGSAVLVADEPTFCIKNVALIKPRRVAPTFLIRLINSPVFQRYLVDNLDGGIQKFISLGTLRQLSIPLPDDAEQRAIAEALSDADALLGGLDRLIAKKRDLKQAAMQQLLTGQTRLPGFHGEWEVKRLGEFASFCSGQYLAQDAYRDGEFEVQGAGSPMGKHDNGNFLEPISVLGRVGTVGRPRFMPSGCWVNNNAAAIVAKPSLATPRFVHLLLMTMDWSKATSVTAQPFLVVESLMTMEFPLPLLPEQTAIAEVLTDMDAELVALERRRGKTRALKEGMMQELLTGRIRLV